MTADHSEMIVRQMQELCQKYALDHDQPHQPSYIPKISLDVRYPLLAELPAVAEFIQMSINFRKRTKEQTFPSGRAVDEFKSEHDPTFLSLVSQSYHEIVHSLCASSTDIPGVTKAQLTKFKEEFSHLAFVCRFFGCHGTFSSMEELEDHELSRHTGGIRCIELSCPFSRIGFPTSKALKSHIRNYHNDKPVTPNATSVRRRWECEGCSQQFSLKRELMRHKESRKGTPCGTTASPQQLETPQFNLDFGALEDADILEPFDFDTLTPTQETASLRLDAYIGFHPDVET